MNHSAINPRHTNQPTTLSSWVVAICRALDARGCDSQRLLAEAELDGELSNDFDHRISTEKVTRLWELAVAETDDECFGLSLAQHVQPTTLHALGYALLASSTLEDCLERVARFYRMISDAADVHLRQGDQETALEYHLREDGPRVSFIALDAFTAMFVKLFRDLAQQPLNPVRIDFERDEPERSQAFSDFFQCPIRYSRSCTRLVFSNDVLQQRLPAANSDLARANDQVILNYLQRFDRSNMSNQVNAQLVRLLPRGEPSQEYLARELGTSVRSMQRKLKQQGTSYRQLLNDTRRQLAADYLRQPSCSVTEVTYQLGFSDASNFTRAFRRWFGMSPTEYRQQHGND